MFGTKKKRKKVYSKQLKGNPVINLPDSLLIYLAEKLKNSRIVFIGVSLSLKTFN